MKVEKFLDIIGADFYSGVPDSQLKSLCNYLINTYGINNKHHIIAANEGNATALAAGYHLATGKTPVVYLQNSGEGNIINPLASLMNKEVYAIPCIFIIGWRGEPGIHDEPQHVYQGKITCRLLENMDIDYFIISQSTTEDDLQRVMDRFKKQLSQGKDVAFIVKKDSLTYNENIKYKNDYTMTREKIIQRIVTVSDDDPIICTTGKASRELFEIREVNNQGHERDFLTVGSMGHASSIALGVALNKPHKKVWCIDGDGAVLMHMGAMAVIGNINPKNLIHIVINNGAHETVGGMPTAASCIDLTEIAKACGYTCARSIHTLKELDNTLITIRENEALQFLEIKSSLGARADLGRPYISAVVNKSNFMKFLS